MLVGFVAFMGPVAGFMAVRTEVLDSFAIAPLGVVHPAIAIIAIISFGRGRTCEKEKATESQRGESRFAEGRTKNGEFHKASTDCARAGFGMTS
jgi:hypothetical protein